MNLKRLFRILLLTVTVCIIMSGCGMGGSVPDVRPVTESNAVISFDGTTYRCEIRRISSEQTVMTFVSPESLSGLVFSQSGKICTLSMDKCACRNLSLPESGRCVFVRVCGILDLLARGGLTLDAKSDDGRCVFSSENGGLSVTTDSDGRPLTVKAKDISIELSEPRK